MARRVIWGPSALLDIDDIAAHIRHTSPEYASRFIARVFRAAEGVELFPEAGAIVPEFERLDIRELFVGRYRLIDECHEDEVRVQAVVHGMREFGVLTRFGFPAMHSPPPPEFKDETMTRPHGLRLIVASLALALTTPAFSHPGHGTGGGSHELTHYFTEPVHLAPLAAAALAGGLAAATVAWYRRKA